MLFSTQASAHNHNSDLSKKSWTLLSLRFSENIRFSKSAEFSFCLFNCFLRKSIRHNMWNGLVWHVFLEKKVIHSQSRKVIYNVYQYLKSKAKNTRNNFTRTSGVRYVSKQCSENFEAASACIRHKIFQHSLFPVKTTKE